MDITFNRINSPDWAFLDRLPDRTIFQTKPWLEFVSEAQKAEICVLEVRVDAQLLGYFTGLIIRKAGFRILGSPFPGWSTDYLGFNLMLDTDRTTLLAPLARFAFRELGCWHVELMDRRLTVDMVRSLGWRHRLFDNSEIDLSLSEDRIFANFKGSCRTSIRKAEKCGVTVEASTDPEFADDYYTQLVDVFAKQNLRPTYSVERVRLLIKHLMPTGHLLLVRARNAEGLCVATGIFPAFNRTMHFWGGASLRQHQILQPNEAILWFAMRYWKAHGISVCDMGGGGTYKAKYGGGPFVLPWCRISRNEWVANAREIAQQSYAWLRHTIGRGMHILK